MLVWDVASGRVCRVFRGHKKPVHSVDFSSCGRFLASASADGTCATLERCTHSCFLTLLPTDVEFYLPPPRCNTFHFALTLLRIWPAGTVKLWSVDTLQPERTETGMPSLSHKGPDVMQQELQSMHAKDPDTCYTTVQFTRRNLLLAAGYVNT
eukprot:COSAG02_NODE_2975_length_7633_cov_3.190072_2_plen_153_part_00